MSVQPVGVPHEPLLALVDTGVNYNLSMVQKNLAIDQDGQLIGYDFWDNDNRPFDKDPRRNAFFHFITALPYSALLAMSWVI